MRPSSATSPRGFLQTCGRAVHAPSAALAALTLINAAGAGVFALALTLLLTGRSPAPALGGLVAGAMLRALAGQASSRVAARHALRVKSHLRRRLLASVLDRPRGGGASVGEATAAVVDEIEALDGYFSQFQPAALDARIGPLLIAGAIALASPVSAAVLLLTLIPLAAIMALAGSAAGAEANRQFVALARLSGHFVDRVRALPVVLAFQAEDRETARVAAAAQDVSRRTLGVLRIAFVSTAGLEFFAAVSVALVAVYCGFSLLGLLPFKVPETLDFRRAFFALALAPEFYAPLRRLAAAYHEKQLGEAAAAKLQPLLQALTPPPPAATSGPGIRPDAPPEVRLRHLAVRFDDLTIGPIDDHAPAGALTALVGPTGSGKSTLLSTILGLAPPDEGSVEIAGRQGDPADGLAESAAWAGQSPVFLPGTLLENLTAAAGVSREAALAMIEQVGLSPAIARRPRGVDTVLDERGSGLSGGERRRLALARALLKSAPLLLLDEPTADLDAKSEAEIIALIRMSAGERTVIVATHSEALAAAADHVVRLT